MKKLLALVLALTMMLGLGTVGTNAATDDFGDSKEIVEEYKEAIAVMNAIGVFIGDGENFRPTDTMKRSEVAKVVAYLMVGKETSEAQVATGRKYNDLAADHWAGGYIELLTSLKVMAGVGDNKVDPDGQMRVIDYAKMLLVALGFDAQKENLVGPDYQIYTNALANKIGLFKGYKGDINIVAPVTRQEAALFAFNTVKSPLVQYKNKASTISVNGAEINFGGSEWEYMTTTDDAARYRDIKNHKANYEFNAQIIEYGEQYFQGLKLDDAGTDDFGRPCSKWTYKNVEIGKFVKYGDMIYATTEPFSGKTMNETIGQSVIENSIVRQFVDCVEVTDKDITAANMIKKNDDAYNFPDWGALTEVFQVEIDNDAQYDYKLYFVTINNYFAEATSDYNSKTDEIRLKVFAAPYSFFPQVDYSSRDSMLANLMNWDEGKTITVKGEDVPFVKNLKKDDTVILRMDLNNTTKPEVEEAFDFSAKNKSVALKEYSVVYRKKWIVSTDGDTMNWNRNISLYDTDMIKKDDAGRYDYIHGNEALDCKYTVYLDQNGYVLGLRPEETEKQYVFVTGFDTDTSHIANKDITVNAIFLDGTMKTIKVDVDKTEDNFYEDPDDHDSDLISDVLDGKVFSDIDDDVEMAQYNMWFTYTVKDGVYTLDPVTRVGKLAIPGDSEEAKNHVINTANVTLKDEGFGTDYRAYGNDESVYVLAEGDKITIDGGDKVGVVKKVKSVYTGAQNVSIQLFNSDDDGPDGSGKISGKGDVDTELEDGAFFCANDDNYIVGVVCLGKDKGTTKNYIFMTGKIAKEYKDDKNYFWDLEDVLINGEMKNVTIKGDKNDYKKIDNKIKGMSDYGVHPALFYAEFDADGFITDIYRVDIDEEGGGSNVGDVYTIADYRAETLEDDEHDLSDFSAVDIVVTRGDGHGFLDLYGDGNTLYAYGVDNGSGYFGYSNGSLLGIAVKKGAPIYVHSFTVNVAFTDLDDEVIACSSLSEAVNVVNDVSASRAGTQFYGEIAAGLDANGVAQWIVIKDDTFGYKRANPNKNIASVEIVNGVLYTYGIYGLQQTSIYINNQLVQDGEMIWDEGATYALADLYGSDIPVGTTFRFVIGGISSNTYTWTSADAANFSYDY